MRESKKFCQRGPNLTVILIDEGREDPNTMWASIGPPAKRHLNDVPLACR